MSHSSENFPHDSWLRNYKTHGTLGKTWLLSQLKLTRIALASPPNHYHKYFRESKEIKEQLILHLIHLSLWPEDISYSDFPTPYHKKPQSF